MNIRNIYAKYEHPVSYSKKAMANVQKQVKGHSQGHTFKIYVIIGKALSKGTHLPNMKALSLRIKKLWLMTKFLRRRLKVTFKVPCSKFMVSAKRSCHKEHTCQI